MIWLNQNWSDSLAFLEIVIRTTDIFNALFNIRGMQCIGYGRGISLCNFFLCDLLVREQGKKIRILTCSDYWTICIICEAIKIWHSSTSVLCVYNIYNTWRMLHKISMQEAFSFLSFKRNRFPAALYVVYNNNWKAFEDESSIERNPKDIFVFLFSRYTYE